MMRSIFISLICTLFFITLGYADIPKTLNFQAKLTDNDGAPLNGPYNITFAIYEKNGQTALWQEEHKGANVVSISEGICNVILGFITPLNIDFDKPYFITITIDGQALMERYPLSPSAYALNADKLGGLPYTNFFRADSKGNVGIGTANPSQKLEIAGNFKYGDNLLISGGNNFRSYKNLAQFISTSLSTGAPEDARYSPNPI